MESKTSPAKRLTLERLLGVMSYDPETGIFIHIEAGKGKRIGERVGSANNAGYLRTKIDGEHHFLHHLAFVFMNGTWPRYGVDHKNGARDDNKWSNLRDVPYRVNAQNRRRPMIVNKSGMLGVSPSESGKWRASIGLGDSKVRQLGTFDTPELAHIAYIEAKRRLHEGNTL